MIDLHNHILPGLDDGARDLTESLEIAAAFASEGVTRVAATPHLDPTNHRGALGSEVRALVEDVQRAIQKARIPLAVLPGQELFLTPDAPHLLREGTALSLNDTRWVLVETSFAALQPPPYLEDTVFRLQVAGFRPILAHPERYAFVQRNLDSVDGLVARGVQLQLTAPALLGDYGRGVRRTAEGLLARGAYTLAASDRHHPGAGRSLVDLHQRISYLTDEETADLLLQDNPDRVLSDREPVPAEQHLVNRSTWTRLFGR